MQGWVETALGSEEVTKIKTALDTEIAEHVSPTSVQKTLSA